MILELPGRRLDLSTPAIMGVLNVTPDSFSDGGRHVGVKQAVARVREMMQEGAAIIDVGGESTRPGAAPVSEQEELDRVLPLIERLSREVDCVISIDTMKASVMTAAIAVGAHVINDVNALRSEGAMQAARASGAAICLMHMQGKPRSMQASPEYGDVVEEVASFLKARVGDCERAGIARSRLLVDPGFGFGKLLQHNLALLGRLSAFDEIGLPLLIGVSRKSMLGQVGGLPVEQRLHPGLAAAAIAVFQGARIVRTHDVRATVEAVEFASAVRRAVPA